MASVAHYRQNQYHGRKKINCRTFHSFHPKSAPKNSRIANFIHKDPAFIADFSCSELWAGPAYTNSPPPSSVPIPKFSLRQKRSVSLELPPIDTRLSTQPAASKSAPASPTSSASGSSSSPDLFVNNTASATENLRRILNLDVEI